MPMTYDEARALAIKAGALDPQGMTERMACGFKKSDNWAFQWSEMPIAQWRVDAWTQAILDGVPVSELRRRIG